MKKIEFLYLSQEDIIGLGITWDEVMQRTEIALKSHGAKEVENPPKPGVHTRHNTFIHAMPAYLKQEDIVGLKWVSGYPDNYRYGLPQIMGLMVINSAETGMPLAVMDCRWITAARTAAVTGITIKHCARKDSKKVAIVGAGVQGRMNLKVIDQVLPNLEECWVYDIKDNVLEDCIIKLSPEVNVPIYKAKSVEEAVSGADVVLTATQKMAKPIIEEPWLKKGVLGLGLEANRAWSNDVLFKFDKFITDDLQQALLYQSQGAFSGGIPPLYAETGEIVAGTKAGRENDEERIIALNIGMACEDVSLGQYVYEVAKSRDKGIMLPLMESEF